MKLSILVVLFVLVFGISCKKAGKRGEELSTLQPFVKPYVLLSGRVVEPIGNKAIVNARVEVIGGEKTQTDEFGVFFFKVKKGDIKLKIEKDGFAPTYRILKSVEDDTRVDIPLNYTFLIENKNGALRANGFVLKTDIKGESAEFTNIIKNIDSLPGDFSSPTFNSFGFFKQYQFAISNLNRSVYFSDKQKKKKKKKEVRRKNENGRDKTKDHRYRYLHSG